MMYVHTVASAIVLASMCSASFTGMREYDHARGQDRQQLDDADIEIEPEYYAYSGFATSAVEDDMTLDLVVDGKVMEITMTGPADSWFGWGLDSSTMQDAYAIIAHEGGVTEHKLSKKSNDQSDTETVLDLIVVHSDTTEGNLRTVRLTRTSVGGDNHQNDVIEGEGDFYVISARSDPANPSMSVAQHTKSSRGASVMGLVASASGGYAAGKDGGGPPEDELDESFHGLQQQYEHVRDDADVEIEPEYFAYSGFATSAVEDDMTLNLEVDGKVMEITMTGPADSWFGWGLDSSTMQDTYAIIVHEDGVTEHKLSKKSEDQADTEMALDLVVVRSDTTEGSVRTVRLTRTSVGGDNHQNDVVDSEGDFDVISARSDPANPSMSVAQHTKSSRGASVLNLVASASAGYAHSSDSSEDVPKKKKQKKKKRSANSYSADSSEDESELAVDVMVSVVDGLDFVNVQTLLAAAIVVAVVLIAVYSVRTKPRKEEQWSGSTNCGPYGSV